YVTQSLYHEQLVRPSAYYPRDRVLVLLFEDLMTDAVGTFRALCGHLGIDPNVIPASVGETKNPYRESRAAPVVRFLMRPAVNRRIPQRLWPPIRRLLTRQGGSPPPLEPDVREPLARYFGPATAGL